MPTKPNKKDKLPIRGGRRKYRRPLVNKPSNPETGDDLKERYDLMEAKDRIKKSTKLSKGMIQQACELVAEGLPLASVWSYLGVTKMAAIAWKEKGEKFLIEMYTDRGPEFPEDELEAMFCMELARARATLELDLIREIRDPRKLAYWVRNMTMLERRFRENWSRSETMRVETAEMVPDEAYL